MAHSNKTMTFATDLLPQEDETYSLGNSSQKWHDIYATTFNGNLTGTATTATNATISANVTTDADYPIVFATSNIDITVKKEEGLQKSGAKFYFNPSTGLLTATAFAGANTSKTAAGLCPQLPNESTTTRFLRQDGKWEVPDYIADTHYTTHLYVNATSGGATSDAATTNTTTYMHLYDDSTKRKTIQFKGLGATTVSATSSATGSVISIDSSNTATAIDNILDGSNDGTAITYAPYTTRQNKLSFDTSTAAPDGTSRLNLNGFLYATQYNVAGHVTLQWNPADSSLDFVFA